MTTQLSDVLHALPPHPTRNMAIHVKPAAERALRDGHPWVFEDSIRSVSYEGGQGTLAVIFDRKDRFLAVGLYDPDSEIRVKVLHHHTRTRINGNWFAETLKAAVHIREAITQTDTNGYRVVYGEGDRMPGFIVDRYAQTLVVKLYSAAWLPHLRDVLPALVDAQQCERLVLRLSRNLQSLQTYGLLDGQTLLGTPPDAPVTFRENGLEFMADVVAGHKTGFFFDQRDNRSRVRDITPGGAAVLDVFAYTGGFSVYAAAGGARTVTSLDVSEPALMAAKHNMTLNVPADADVAKAKHDIMVADAFEGMQALRSQGRRFDVVVIDPPAFAKRQTEVDGARRAYARLAELGGALVRDGGQLVMASCSSRVKAQAFFDVVKQSVGRPLTNVQHTGHALDHPVTFPEGEYLKCLFASVG